MAKTISFRLTPTNIDKAIAEVVEYEKSIKGKSAKLIKKLSEKGVEIVRKNILNLDILDTGELYNSVSVFYSESENAGYILIDCDYALFVEFGTGIVGKTSPYPGEAMAEIGYQYGGGTTYVVTKDGRIGWFYPADDGTWRFTEGMPSRPFIHNSVKELKKLFPTIAKEVFK